MAQFEETVRVNVQMFSESRAVSFNGDALQHHQSVIDSRDGKDKSRDQLQDIFLNLRFVPLIQDMSRLVHSAGEATYDFAYRRRLPTGYLRVSIFYMTVQRNYKTELKKGIQGEDRVLQ